jgi:hypothetical protein
MRDFSPVYVRCGSDSDVGSMSGLPKSGHDWAIYKYTPELDAARRSRALILAGSTAPPARRRHWRAKSKIRIIFYRGASN